MKPDDRRRTSPQLDFSTWLRLLSPHQVKRAKLAFDEVLAERDDDTSRPQGARLPKSGDQDGPLPDEIMRLLKAKLSEEELQAVVLALKQRADDQQEEEQQQRQKPAEPSRDQPPPFSGRPTAGAGQDPITSALRRGGSQTAAAMDASPRIRSETPAQLTYINGTPANGIIGGVRYLHGLACKRETAPTAAASEDFASRFPEIARVRVV